MEKYWFFHYCYNESLVSPPLPNQDYVSGLPLGGP